MTLDRLRAVLTLAVTWLGAWALLVIATAALFGTTCWLYTVTKDLIPLAIALPGALFAYTFPMRLGYIRDFATWRTDAVSAVAVLRDAVDNSQSFEAFRQARTRLVELRARAHKLELDANALSVLDRGVSLTTRICHTWRPAEEERAHAQVRPDVVRSQLIPECRDYAEALLTCILELPRP